MGQHLRQRRVVHTLRHVDAGTEQSQHKGCPPRAAAVHVVLQPYRRAYPAVDAQIADQHICQHHHHARQPDRRQQRHGHRRLGRRYRLCRHGFRRRQRRHRLCRAAGQHLVRFLRRLLCLGQLIQRRRHGALLRLEAHRALQGEGQYQPHRHQRPQQAHRPLGRPAQRQPRQHHRQRQHPRLPRKLHDPQKYISHFASPQIRRSSAAARLPPPSTVRARPQRR